MGADDPTAAVVDPLAARAYPRLRRPLGTQRAIELVGAHNLPGLAGAKADGGTWAVFNGNIQATPPSRGATR
jgi:hypothetical protein